MAYVRPTPPLEMNPDRQTMPNAAVWVLGTNGGSFNSLGRLGMVMGQQGAVSQTADAAVIAGGDDQSRLFINGDGPHNSEIFTRVFTFDLEAGRTGNTVLFMSDDGDDGGGYAKGAMEIRITTGGELVINRSNEANIYVGPPEFVTGRNTLVMTRLNDGSMRYSANGGSVAAIGASNYTFGRASFGSAEPRDGIYHNQLNLVGYAQDALITEDAYLVSLSNYPMQLVRTVGSTATPVPSIPATAISLQGQAPIWQVGKANAPLTYSLNGDISQNVTITPSAPNVTFNPATVVLTPTQKSGSTVPTPTQPGNVSVTTTNSGGLSNPPAFAVEMANDISRTVTTVQELKDAAAWAKTLNLVNMQQNAYIRLAANLTLNASTGGVTFEAMTASADYRIIIESNAGQSHSDLNDSGAYNYGTVGREITLATGNALVLKGGAMMRKMRANITAQGGLAFLPGGNGPRPAVDECKFMCNAYGAVAVQAYQVGEATDSLFIRTAAVGGPLVEGAWCWNTMGCTYALVPGATATYAHTGGWGSSSGAMMASNIYVNFGDPVDGDFYSLNNFSTAGANAGVTVANPIVVDASNDFRPAGAALGAAFPGLSATKDGRGNNRGLTPDAGAVQAVPSEDLAELTITSQSFDATTGDLTVTGTFVNAMTTGEMYVRPQFVSNGIPVQGPFAFNINQGAKTFTVTGRLVRGLYSRPELTGINGGGRGPMAGGTTAILNYRELVEPATPNPTVIPPNRHQPSPATGGTKRVEHRRGGNVLEVYSEIGDVLMMDARYGTPRQTVQPGDEIWVYPAVYNKAVWFGGFAGAVMENVKVVGVTVDGVRPVVRWSPNPGGGYGYDSGYGSGNGIVYTRQNKDCTWDNIDVLWNGGYLAKSLIYCYNENGGTTTFKNMRIMGAFRSGENGFLSAHGSNCSILFENVESGFNGGDGGAPPQGGGASLAHGYYITRHDHDPVTGAVPIVTWRGCFFHNAWRGHLLKCRHNNIVIEGCYFAGTPPSTLNDTPYGNDIGPFANPQNNISHASNIDLPNGGSCVIRNNILTKNYTGYDQGRNFFNFAAESDINQQGNGGETDATGVVALYNNTFVAYTDVTTSYSSGTTATADPTGWWWGVGGNPDSGNFRTDLVKVQVRDNVYVAIQNGPWTEPAEFCQKLTIDEINLPGRDNAVPFSPKVPKGSSRPNGGKGYPAYVHRAGWAVRDDANMGAVGRYQSGITATGNPKRAMWTPTRNTDQAGYIALGLNNAFPQQVEWTDAVGGAAPTATKVTIGGASTVVMGGSLQLSIGTDQLLQGAENVSIALSDGASGTFAPATVTRNAANDSPTVVTYTPASAGNKTITATPTGTPTLAAATKVISVTSAAVVDTTPPTVGLVANPTSVTTAGNVTLSATATDAVGVTRVEFFRDTTLVGTVTAAPYQFSVPVTRADNGTVVFKAKAYDAALNTSEATANVVVNIPVAAPRAIALPLTTDGVTPVPDTTGLQYAFFDQALPTNFTAPTVKGTNGSIVGGVFNLQLPGSALPAGGVGCLVLTNSNGSPTQSPPALVFFGPVTVN